MSLYESTFIIRHDMTTQQIEQLAETFDAIVKDNGGEVTCAEHVCPPVPHNGLPQCRRPAS